MLIIDISLTLERAKFKDLGIGVADKEIELMPLEYFLSFSFCLTPNLCSSSITKSPKSQYSSWSLKSA